MPNAVLAASSALDIYVGAVKAKCSVCGSSDWVLEEPEVELRAMTQVRCVTCHRVVLYAELVVQTSVATKEPPPRRISRNISSCLVFRVSFPTRSPHFLHPCRNRGIFFMVGALKYRQGAHLHIAGEKKMKTAEPGERPRGRQRRNVHSAAQLHCKDKDGSDGNNGNLDCAAVASRSVWSNCLVVPPRKPLPGRVRVLTGKPRSERLGAVANASRRGFLAP